MTPAARVQGAIDLLDAIIVAARDAGGAADSIAARWFKERRYAGSGDRRAIRALVWRAIRTCGERPASGRSALLALAADDADLAALFTGDAYAPALITAADAPAEQGLIPMWLRDELDRRIDDAELAALLERAPVDLRVKRVVPADIVLPDGDPLPPPLTGLRLPPDTMVTDHPAFRAGLVEIQDAGSQLIAAACAVQPGMTVVDLCAGAGGKTLALLDAMNGLTDEKSWIIACDTDRRRLGQLTPRLHGIVPERLALKLLDPGKESEALAELSAAADVVLIDAPCSGSGTWRRNPEARWRLTPDRLDKLVSEQARLLDIGAALVRPGGTLIYAVCAVTRREGSAQVAAFVARHRGWTVLPLPFGRPSANGVLLTPLHDATDGFFFARMQAP
jgi:16S rRNA (cytosine967-C5)-methyltransferase